MLARARVRHLILAAPLTLLACASGDPSTAPSDGAGSPRAGATTSAVVHLSATPDTGTPLSLQVAPDAECTIRGISPAPELIASARGVLRFVATIPAMGTELPLECARPDGTINSYLLAIAAATQGEAPITSNVVEATLAHGAARRALEEDATTLSDEELVARGFPPPPNRDPSSAAYVRWLTRARTPGLLMTPHARKRSTRAPEIVRPTPIPLPIHPPILPKPAIVQPTTDSAWSGYLATPSSATVWQATGEWVVPAVSGTGISAMGQWVGLGGWFDNGLIQAGTTGETGIGINGTIISSYNAFYEYWASNDNHPHFLNSTGGWPRWYPSDPPTEWTFAVGPSDSYEVTVWAGDSRGNLNVTGGYGWYFIEAQPNATSSNPSPSAEYYIGNLPAPATSSPFEGSTAEWVVERPLGNPLSDFAGTRISNATAYGPNSYTQTPGDGKSALVSSITNASGSYLDVAFTESSAVGFIWGAAQ